MAGPYTMSELGTPSGAHTGIQWTGGVITLSASTTASAVVNLCRVPNGAVIVDWVLYGSDTNQGSGLTVKLGTSACVSGIASAISISASASAAGTDVAAGAHRPKGTDDLLPVKVSLSDDQGKDQKVWLQMKFVSAPTTSASVAIFRFGVWFVNGNGIAAHNTVR